MAHETFKIDGADIMAPTGQMDGALRSRLQSGQYEQHERKLIKRFLRPKMRVLDVGAAIGLTSIAAARIAGGAAVTVVEANPEVYETLETNLAKNVQPVPRVVKAAIVGEEHVGDTIVIAMSQAFWATRSHKGSTGNRQIEVPAMRLSELLREVRPQALLMDIEGGETALLSTPLNDELELVIIELHPRLYGDDVADQVRAKLVEQNFTVEAEFQAGEVGAWVRPRPKRGPLQRLKHFAFGADA